MKGKSPFEREHAFTAAAPLLRMYVRMNGGSHVVKGKEEEEEEGDAKMEKVAARGTKLTF